MIDNKTIAIIFDRLGEACFMIAKDLSGERKMPLTTGPEIDDSAIANPVEATAEKPKRGRKPKAETTAAQTPADNEVKAAPVEASSDEFQAIGTDYNIDTMPKETDTEALINRDELKKLLAEYAKLSRSGEKAFALLGKYGVGKVAEMKDQDLPKLYNDVKTAIASIQPGA